MRENVEFITPLHRKTGRDYLARVNEHDKAECAAVARQFGKDYWDGDRRYGYGGYRYDGRWASVARSLVEHYGLSDRSSVLDVGCGKGFLLYEIHRLIPGAALQGVDISEHALAHSKEEVRDRLSISHARKLPFPDRSFDLVISITTLHNLEVHDLFSAVREIARVSRKDGYIAVESYRDEKEKANLLYWQLTCESFHRPDGWRWIYEQCGYRGDHEFIYFE
jgi:SAM-dependent methyltransferase